MNNTEIKKEIYKQKPTAYFSKIRIGIAYYKGSIFPETDMEKEIFFEIPVSDMGEADFEETMEAKLLLRWLI